MKRLAGAVIATTRDGAPADPLVAGLRAEGSRVLEWPTLEFGATRDPEAFASAASRIAEYDWVVLTSARGVAALAGLTEAPSAEGPSAEASKPFVAAVGPATARALSARDWPVTCVGQGGADALVRVLARDFSLDGARVLYPAASRARPTLELALERLGASVDRVEAYHTRQSPPDTAIVRRDLSAGVDVVTFTSPSAVDSLAAALGDDWPNALASCAVVTIGHTTASAARQHGLSQARQAPEATLDGLIEGCVLTLQRTGRSWNREPQP